MWHDETGALRLDDAHPTQARTCPHDQGRDMHLAVPPRAVIGLDGDIRKVLDRRQQALASELVPQGFRFADDGERRRDDERPRSSENRR